jgi:hypothetical protein
VPIEKAMKEGPLQQTLLIQLPIPQLNFGKQTGNIPLGAACLKMAANAAGERGVELLPESVATYFGDAQLLNLISEKKPGIIGFTVYAWNVDRVLYLARELKSRYMPFIVFGGPEVTPDNPKTVSPSVDLHIYGEGEGPFVSLLRKQFPKGSKSPRMENATFFLNSGSPYPANLLEPDIEKMILVETQRGCPYHCGYCYYGKSRKRVSAISRNRVLQALQWAIERSIPEGCLLDPCLNARKDIDPLLSEIAETNQNCRIKLISEIRAENVTEKMADGFAKAGFTWFEVGLQSTNPTALSVMNRSTDLNAFLRGAKYLKEREIQLGIDLIAGLPGDAPSGFSNSVDFLLENDLVDEVQVFPLSVLPGTPFRKRSKDLGLVFDPAPPYTIIETPTFSRKELSSAMEEAEDRFDLSLYPCPDLELSGCNSQFAQKEGLTFHQKDISGCQTITKVLINRLSEPAYSSGWPFRLAHPYQLFFGPKVSNEEMVCRIIRRLTTENPFTPLEIVFVEPQHRPSPSRMLSASALFRPHYLDKYLVFQYPTPGNRAILFTLLSKKTDVFFQEEMQRQILWWAEDQLPSPERMQTVEQFDGIFIPDNHDFQRVRSWQKRIAPFSEDLPAITFSLPMLQKNWVRLTQADEYWMKLL